MARGVALGVALLAACTAPRVEPQPLRGEPPRVVAIWPVIDGEFAAVRALLLSGLDAAVRARGYEVMAPDVVLELLRSGPAEPTPATSGPLLACDAVLEFVPHEFAAEGVRPLRHAAWRVEWRLVSTPGGGVLWSWSSAGSWAASNDDGRDPHRALDAEPDYVPFGGGRAGNYRDALELVAALHRSAMARLPRGRG